MFWKSFFAHCTSAYTRNFCCRHGASGAQLFNHEGSGSGGYLEYTIRHAARELFAVELNELTFKTLRYMYSASFVDCVAPVVQSTTLIRRVLHSTWPEISKIAKINLLQQRRLMLMVVVRQKPRHAGNQRGSERRGSSSLCCGKRLPKHPKYHTENQTWQNDLRLCRNYGVSFG